MTTHLLRKYLTLAIITAISATSVTTAQTQQTIPPLDDSAVNWSFDGEYLAFNANLDGDNEIYIVKTDGSDRRKLTDNDTEDKWPSFSRDGKSILYSARVDRGDDVSDWDVYILDIATGNSRYLFGEAGSGRHEYRPLSLPDGRIGFTYKQDGNVDVAIRNPKTRTHQIVFGGPRTEILARWSDVGTFVATSDRESDIEQYDLFLANWDGTDRRYLKLYPAEDREGAGSSSPDISRDGRFIVYASTKGGSHKFDFNHWLYDVETGEEEKLPRPEGSHAGVMSFSPDRKFVSYAVDYDGDGPHQIAIRNLETLAISHIDIVP
jgi:Tol biopolymer transport system component